MDSTDWDESQRAVLDTYKDYECISILGAAGTGKTALLEEIAAREIDTGSTVAFLVHDRRAAHESFLRLTRRCDALSADVSVRSLSSFCYGIVQEFAEQTGRVRPELISGAEQDARFRSIINSGDVSFPDFFDEDVLGLSSFRNEIRNLVTRAGELGLTPDDLSKLGSTYSQPLWSSTADVWSAYVSRLAQEEASASSVRPPLRSAQRLDHSQLVSVAIDMLEHWNDEVRASSISMKPVRVPHWDYVFIDDLQNAPHSMMKLIGQLRRGGARIVCAGNPDSNVQGFRGGVFSLPIDICSPPPSGIDAHPCVLTRRHRGGEYIARALGGISSHIRRPSLAKEFGALRTPIPGNCDDSVTGKAFANESEEASGIAGLIRRWHLRDGIAYSDIAVMTRSRSVHEEIRHELQRRGVPVASIGSLRPLSQHPAVAGLVDLIDLALGADGDGMHGDAEQKAVKVRSVLTSPLFALSSFEVDMLEQLLCSYGRMQGVKRNTKEVLADLADCVDAEPSGIDIVDVFRSVISSISRSNNEEMDAEQVLWTAWDMCNVSDKWHAQALSNSEYSELANDNLDAVLQLFYFVQREIDREPSISIEQIFRRFKSQELPQDSLVGKAKKENGVTLITPASAQGSEFSHLVIARLNDGVWPNLTVRDGLVHTEELSDIVLGRYVPELTQSQRFQAQIYDVLDDELRQLYAGLGRATHCVVFTCVANSQSRPSRFFDAMGFETQESAYTSHTSFVLEQCSGVASRFDMTGLIGQLRRYAHGDGEAAQRARQMLSNLAAHGVLQAEPAQWCDVYEPTSLEQRNGIVSVSPSRVEATLNCPLNGIMQGLGFSDKTDMRMADIGTLIHEIASRYKDGGCGELSEDELCQEMLDVFSEEFDKHFVDHTNGWSERDKETYALAIERLAHFLHARANSGEYKRVEAEYCFTFEEAGGRVSGSIDRLEIGEQSSFIYDYKTGRNAPSQGETASNAQLQLYQLALTYADNIPHASWAKLLYPNTASKKMTERTQEGIDKQAVIRRLSTYVDYEKSAVIPAQTSSKCRQCRYRSVCPLDSRGRIFS